MASFNSFFHLVGVTELQPSYVNNLSQLCRTSLDFNQNWYKDEPSTGKHACFMIKNAKLRTKNEENKISAHSDLGNC